MLLELLSIRSGTSRFTSVHIFYVKPIHCRSVAAARHC